MELLFLLSTSFFVCLVVACFWFVHQHRPHKYLQKLGIKHPPTNFYYGNAEELTKLGVIKAYDEWIQTYGRVCGYYVGAKPYILVADLEMIKEITVKQSENFINNKGDNNWIIKAARGGIPGGLVSKEGEEWRQKRNMLSPGFSAKKIKEMASHINSCCNQLLLQIQFPVSKSSVNITKLFGKFAMQTSLLTTFGRHVKILEGEADELTEAAEAVFSATRQNTSIRRYLILNSHFPLLLPFLKKFVHFVERTQMADAYKTLAKVAKALIEVERRSSGHDQQKMPSSLHSMIDSSNPSEGTLSLNKNLSDNEIAGLCIGLLLGGYDTTCHTLGFTSYLLAIYPEKQQKLCQAIDDYYSSNEDISLYEASQSLQYLDWVVQESLRLYSPAVWTERRCVRSTKISGVSFPEESHVMIPIQSLHMMTEYWERPCEFEPERFSMQERNTRPSLSHAPFGYGPRHCLGMRLALVQVKMALLNILKEMKFVRADDTEVPLKTSVGITQAPQNGIHLLVERR